MLSAMEKPAYSGVLRTRRSSRMFFALETAYRRIALECDAVHQNALRQRALTPVLVPHMFGLFAQRFLESGDAFRRAIGGGSPHDREISAEEPLRATVETCQRGLDLEQGAARQGQFMFIGLVHRADGIVEE